MSDLQKEREARRRDRRRLVVCQPEPPAPGARLAVGILRWVEEVPRVSVIAKATLGYELDGAVFFAPEPAPLTLGRPLDGVAGGPREVAEATDVVPRKSALDVLLTGVAHAREAATRIHGSLRLATVSPPPAGQAPWGMSRSFVVAASSPATAIPLTTSYLSPSEGSQAERLGPERTDADPKTPGDSFDARAYAAAPPAQQLAWLPDEALSLHLEGLSPGGHPLALELPALTVRVTLIAALWGDHELPMRCDTLAIDTEARRITLTFRGDVEVTQDGREIRRIIASVERRGEERTDPDRLAYLQRGTVAFAAEPEDLEPGAPPIPDEHPRLTAARYATWRSKAPPPQLVLDDYTRVAVELAEQREARATVLARYGFDEDRWTIEERGWLEAMARDALQGDVRLAALHAERFVAIQRELADEVVPLDVATYARTRAALELGEQPSVALSELNISAPAWLRIDDDMKGRAAADPALAAELEELLQGNRAMIEASRALDEDDEA